MAVFSVGNIVIYRARPAVVAAVAGEKLELLTASGDGKSVRFKDVELLHRGSGRAALPPVPERAPDCAEAAELMESETLPFVEFTSLLFGSDNSGNAIGAWEILTANLYFAGSVAEGVRCRPCEEVAAALAKRDEKERAAAQRAGFLDRVKTGALQEGDRQYLRDVEMLAYGETENSKTMRELGIEATREKAQQLLLRTGVWDDFIDPWPRRFAVPVSDPAIGLAETPEEPREDLTAMEALAIDDADSHDPDDAVSFADGLVWIHVADPASVVTSGSEADAEAAARGSNLYIPELVSHMLPFEATQRYGLGLNPVSPAISFALKIDSEGRAELAKMCLSTIKVTRCSYSDAEALWDGPTLAGIRPELERFRERREADGALFIRLPEVKIRFMDGRITFIPVPVTPVRELVANSMLAAGAAVARRAAAEDIPLPFAVQSPPDTAERGETMAAMFSLRRSCAASVMTTTPGLHAGLGLDPYVRVTSPLRRYGDLLALQQLRRAILGQSLMPASEIEERAAAGVPGAEERRKLERQCNEFWTMVWLKQHPDYECEAVLVSDIDGRRTFIIPELAYEYKTRYPGKLLLGDIVKLKLTAADPAALTARFSVQKI
ncbi:MAG: RNB domain-containing ribonuclease [Victivallaceae bacterium]|nr:RNB domain-containing ribonuclease [Victivallaceae bacterium]